MNPWVQSPALHKTSMVAQAYNPSTEEEEVGGRWLHWLSSCRSSNRKTCKAADRFCCGSQGTHLQFALDSVIVEVMWSEYTWSQKVSVQLNSCSPKLATANSLPLAPTSKWSTLVCYRGKLKKLGAFCPPAVGSVTQIHWQTVGTVLQSAPVLISCLWLSCFDLTFPPGCRTEGLRWLQPKYQIVPSYLSLQTNKYCIVPLHLIKIHPNNVTHLSTTHKGKFQTQCLNNFPCNHWERWNLCFVFTFGVIVSRAPCLGLCLTTLTVSITGTVMTQPKVPVQLQCVQPSFSVLLSRSVQHSRHKCSAGLCWG